MATLVSLNGGAAASKQDRVPLTDDILLRRKEAAAALTAAGYPMASGTLDTLVTRGNGPPYRLFGKHAIYRWGDLLAWAQSRVRAPRVQSAAADKEKALAEAAGQPGAQDFPAQGRHSHKETTAA